MRKNNMFERKIDLAFLKLCIYFTVFSFCGWISETIICSVNERKFVKRGFLTGPFIPVYGFGGIIVVILLSPFKGNPLLLYILGVISVTILEYSTALLMEGIFNLKLWDYSDNKFNYKGRIWLVSSLFFGILGLIGVYILNPPLTSAVESFSNTTIIVLGVTIILYFLLDTLNSVIAVASINNMLKGIRKDIEDIRWLAAQGADLDTAFEASGLEHSVKQFTIDAKESVKELLAKDEKESDKKSSVEESEIEYKTNWFQRRFLNAYPKMTSKNHSEEFKKLKEKISKKRNK